MHFTAYTLHYYDFCQLCSMQDICTVLYTGITIFFVILFRTTRVTLNTVSYVLHTLLLVNENNLYLVSYWCTNRNPHFFVSMFYHVFIILLFKFRYNDAHNSPSCVLVTQTHFTEINRRLNVFVMLEQEPKYFSFNVRNTWSTVMCVYWFESYYMQLCFLPSSYLSHKTTY